MRTTFERSTLLQAATLADTVAPRRSNITILSHILLEVSDTGARIRSTDLDGELVLEVPAQVARPGVACIPGAMFHTLVAALPEGAQAELSLEPEPSSPLIIKAGRGKYKLPVMDPQDFPAMEGCPATAAEVTVQAADVVRMIGVCGWSVAQDAGRPMLMGLNIAAQHRPDGSSSLIGLGADVKAISRYELPVSAPASWPEHGITIPKEKLPALRKLLDGAAVVTIRATEGKAEFEVDGRILRCRLIGDPYLRVADLSRIAPTDYKNRTRANRAQFSAAIARVRAFIDPNAKDRFIILRMDCGVMDIEAGAGSLAAREDLEVAFDGEAGGVALNDNILSRTLDALSWDTIDILWTDNKTPVSFIRAEDEGVFSSKHGVLLTNTMVNGL